MKIEERLKKMVENNQKISPEKVKKMLQKANVRRISDEQEKKIREYILQLVPEDEREYYENIYKEEIGEEE